MALDDNASGAGHSAVASAGQRTQWVGTAMVLGSAAGFSTLAIFAKLAYAYIPMVIVYLLAFCVLFLYRIDRGVHESNLRTL